MAGTLGNVKVLVFKNKKKRNASDPDYVLCLDSVSKAGEHGEPPAEEE